jgi:hypothetical protein
LGNSRIGLVDQAARVSGSGQFVGFAGLDDVDEEMPFTGVEVGWRLAHSAWGHGYATEAALACLDFGFERIGLDEILALTTVSNVRSQAVMRRIGMTTTTTPPPTSRTPPCRRDPCGRAWSTGSAGTGIGPVRPRDSGAPGGQAAP